MQICSVLMFVVYWSFIHAYGGVFNFNSYTPLRKLFSLNFIKPLVALRLCMPYTPRATSQASRSKDLLALNQMLSAIAAFSCTGLVRDQQPGETWDPFFLQARSISPSRTPTRNNRRKHRVGKANGPKGFAEPNVAHCSRGVWLAQDTELTEGFRPQRKSSARMGENEGRRRSKEEPTCIPREDLSHAMA